MTEQEQADQAAAELDHPCKQTCSGWKRGYEKGQNNCLRCGDLFYHPKTIIEAETQRAAEWEEVARRTEERLKAAREEGVILCIKELRGLQNIGRHQKLWNSSSTTTFAPVELSDWLLVNALKAARSGGRHGIARE